MPQDVTPDPPPPLRALALVAPGLDGGLAARLLAEQGVEVQALHFATGFARRQPMDRFGLPVEVVDVRRAYLREVMASPRFGTGAGANPCLDCKVFLLRRGRAEAEARGAGLLCTGEVVGQDGMSQRREWLARAETLAGVADRVLRPLSARHLPETAAETSGALDRSRLGAAHGRTRAVQAALAARFGLPEVPASAGGCCRLPEPAFAARVRDLLAHRALETIGREDLAVLHLGRHFRLHHALKAVVSRNEAETAALRAISAGRFTAQVQGGRGALVWLDGTPRGEGAARAAALAARYGHAGEAGVEVSFERGEERFTLRARPASERLLASCAIRPGRFAPGR